MGILLGTPSKILERVVDVHTAAGSWITPTAGWIGRDLACAVVAALLRAKP
jgi:hypothetical protein